RGRDGLGEVQVDLARVDVEGRGELDVPDMVVAQSRAHEPGHEPVLGGLPVVLDPLDQSGRTIPDPDDGHTDRSHGWSLLSGKPPKGVHRARYGSARRVASGPPCTACGA